MQRFVSFLLTFVILFSLVPVSPMHSTVHAVKKDKRELREERTASSKLIDNGDGTFTRQIYSKPVHRKKGEQWQEISTKLVPSTAGQEIVSDNTALAVRFAPKMEKGKYLTIQNGQYALTTSFLGAEGEQKKEKSGDATAIYQDNRITYENVVKGVNLRNIVFDSTLKEDLILSSYTGLHIFNFRIDTALHAKKENDGSVIFSDSNGQVVFVLPKPYMTDSNINTESGEPQRSEAVAYEIKKQGKSWLLTLTADESWLRDPAREYPVYIDPTYTRNQSHDTYVSSAYPNQNYEGDWDPVTGKFLLKVGHYDSTTGTNYAFEKFEFPSDLGEFQIDSASLHMYTAHSYYPTTPTGVWLDAVKGNWSASTLTWANQPTSTNIASTQVHKGQWAVFDITNTVKSWAANPASNYGFKLHTGGNGQTFWKKFHAFENAVTDNPPYVSVTYRTNTVKKVSGNAYANGSSSNSGFVSLKWEPISYAEGYKVWLFNGRDYQSFDVGNTTSWTTQNKGIWPTSAEIAEGKYLLHTDGKGTELAVDPSSVYRNSGGSSKWGYYPAAKNYWFRVTAYSKQFGESDLSVSYAPTIPVKIDEDLGLEDFWHYADVPSGKVNATNGNLVVSHADLQVPGLGPDLYVARTYNSRSSADGMFGLGWTFSLDLRLTEEANGHVRFHDADGTTHLFTKNADSTYSRPLGVPWDLQKDAGGFTLTTQEKNKHFFNLNGRLTQIQDANNNSLTLTYNASQQLSTINDASGRVTAFTYHPASGKVKTITDPASRVWTYDYEVNLLKTVTDPMGYVMQYSYTDNHLSSIKDPNHTEQQAHETTFDYVDGRVSTVTDPLDHTTKLSYNTSERKLTVTADDGKVAEYHWSVANNPSKVIVDPAGLNLVTQYVYESNQLVELRDPNNISKQSSLPTNKYQYDDQGNILKSQDPFGKTQQFAYNSNNDVIQFTDENGQSYQNTYDGKNLVSSSTPAQTGAANLYDEKGNITGSTKGLGLADNLLSNPDMEKSSGTMPLGYDSAIWADNGSVSVDASQKKTGNQSLRLVTNSSNTAFGYVAATQEIVVQPNTTYTLSGMIRTANLNNSRAFFNVKQLKADGTAISNTASLWTDNRQNSATGSTTDWVERQLTFTTGSETGRVLIYLEIDHDGPSSGTAWFDNIQLKQEAVLSSYNLLHNAGFEKGFTDWTKISGVGDLDNVQVFDGTQSLKVTRKAVTDPAVQYRQQIVLNQTQAAPITITGMSKAQNVENTTSKTPNESYSLWVNIICADGSLETRQAKFELGTHDWQRAIETISLTKPIRSVEVHALFRGNNTGTVWFDNIRLQEGRLLSQFEYDPQGNYLTKSTTPMGYSNQSSYDLVGNSKTETDAKGNTQTFTSDSLNRLDKTLYPKYDLLVDYDYDRNGNLKQQKYTSQDGSIIYSTSSFGYDEADQLKSATDPLGRTTHYDYDVHGNLQKISDPDGNVIESDYDAGHRLTDTKHNGQTRYHFDYDKNGNPVAVQDLLLNRTTSSLYDEANRLTERGMIAGKINWSYDANHNLKEKKFGTLTYSYAYNNVNQNTRVTDKPDRNYYFDYDEQGTLRSFINGNGIQANYRYDDDSQVSHLTLTKPNGESIADYHFTYDANGNRTHVVSGGKTLTYDFDELNQLTSEVTLTGNTIGYSYDNVGNMKTKTVTDSSGKTVSNIPYTYNAMNQLTSVAGQAYLYDKRGNLTDDGEKQYKWDAVGRLTEVKRKSDGSRIAKYDYDEFNRRIRSTVGSTVTNFIYDGDSNRVLYETNATNQKLRTYTYNAAGTLLSMTESSGDTYFYHHNAHGDVIALTDSNRNLVARYAYDAWGNILQQELAQADKNPYRYAGYRYDAETGLYYLMDRYYDPKTMHFLSRDPEPALNEYAYAGNNPVMFIDPDGRRHDGVGDPLGSGTGGGSGGDGFVILFVETLKAVARSKFAQKVLKKIDLDAIREGREFEDIVLKEQKLKPNHEKVGRSIPDAMDDDTIWEVKDRKYVSMNQQFRDYAETEREIILIVSPKTTRISAQVRRTIQRSEGKIYVRRSAGDYVELEW